jgi:hypothetical protein
MMADLPPNGSGPAAGIVRRAMDILLKPKEAWPVIAAEPATTKSIYVPYVVVLAAIGPFASLIGGQLIGFQALGVTWYPPIGAALTSAILSYGLTLATVFVLALVIDGLAPSFGGQKDQIQALKVAAYSGTAAWVGGVFGLFPMLGLIGLLFALYGLYILYLGLPVLMKVPQDKAAAYAAIVVIVAVVLFLIIGAVVSSITAPSLLGTQL